MNREKYDRFVGGTKTVLGFSAAMGAGIVATTFAKTFTPADLKILGKVTTAVGGYAIAGSASEHIQNYTNRAVDEIANGVWEFSENISAIRADIRAAKKEKKTNGR